jgi:hypothetical protein
MLLPWLGMFEQIALADVFVFHDNIQLPHSHGKQKSFQTRVQIKTQGGWDWLSLPVDRRTHGAAVLINEARFPDQSWRRQHLKAIHNAYRTAPHYTEIFESIVEPLYKFETDLVGEFCIESMVRLCAAMGVKMEPLRTSQLDLPNELAGSPRVLEHCLRFGADRYITGLGALEYIDYDLFEAAGVQIHYIEYARKPYPQIHGEFNPYVTALDLLFNVGRDVRPYFASTLRYWKEMDVARETYKKK